jgi:serine acetyltransferase
VVLPNAEVGAHSTIGAGAVVLHDVSPSSIVVGVPAKNAAHKT